MKAKNITGQDMIVLDKAFQSAISDGYKPTLAIVFCSIVQDRDEIIKYFDSKGITLFGSTTAGEILDDMVYEKSIVAMLLDVNPDYFKIEITASDPSHTYEHCRNLALSAKAAFANPSIIAISSGLTVDAEQIIAGVKSVDMDIPLYGGLAGDDLTMQSSFVFSNAGQYNIGIAGLIFDGDKIEIHGVATSGWDNIGIEKTITKSKGNVVYTIDDEPAVDVFVKFFQFKDNVETEAQVIARNFAQYPLQMKKDNGNIVLRAPLMVDIESRALIFAGGIPEGSKVKFSVPPGFDLIEKTSDEVSLIKNDMPEADALIMFSCKARHMALGPMTADEAESIRGIWGKPLIGFFTYGEIGASKNSSCDFHNETCSMVILKEI
jgi:hypothetical protein